MQIDLVAHRKLQEQGILSIQQHPTLPLLIHNYTQRCQWERLWNDITLQCRGLITDLDGNVVCRPFRKFFNLGEHTAPESTLPPINWQQDFYVSEKMDGSLGVVYPVPDGWAIATRGSFVSEQAVRATKMLDGLNTCFVGGLTYLFEIIYPENRIVVDYGKTEALVLLDVIDNETGKGMSKFDLWAEARMIGCRVAQHHHGLSAETLASYTSDDVNREGVVVRFEDGTRIKIKLDDYCRLHKLLTGLNVRHIWEHLKAGRPLQELIEHVPDEFMGWVKEIANDLALAFTVVEDRAKRSFANVKNRLGESPRKDYAREFIPYGELKPLLFLLLDDRDISDSIWKLIKPESTRTFAETDE